MVAKICFVCADLCVSEEVNLLNDDKKEWVVLVEKV